MKKVLHVITRSDWAGGQKVLYSIVRGLKEFYGAEYHIEVACGPHNSMLIPELDRINVKVHLVKNLVREISPLKDFKAFFELRRIIKLGRYDIVHLHSSKAGIVGRLAARSCRVKKIIYTIHGWWAIEQYRGLKRKLFIWAERFASKFCDKIVLLATSDLKKAKGWKIGKENQYVLIPNAIIPPKGIEKGKLRKELSISENVKIVGNVARLDRPKNPIRFLNIADKVLKQAEDVAFVWIGGSVVEDEYGEYVKNFMESHPEYEGRLFFLGFRKDALELMADFDVFLLTSDSEGFPLVLLEALYHGVIPVTTKNGGQIDVIRDGENGFLYDTEEEAKEIITAILDGRQDIERLREGVLQTAEQYSFEKFIEKYRKLYEQI